MTDTNFPTRLREAMKKQKMTQAELARRTNIYPGAISSYLREEYSPKLDKLQIIADVLDVRPTWLMGYDVPMTRKEPPELSKIPGVIPLKKVRRIPILGEIACGMPTWQEENYDGYFAADEEIRADFIVRAKGDSMIDAGIYDRDLVFLKKVSIVDNAKIAAVRHEDETTLKRVYFRKNEIVLQPCNPDYAPIVYRNEELNDVEILGEYVGVYHAGEYRSR